MFIPAFKTISWDTILKARQASGLPGPYIPWDYWAVALTLFIVIGFVIFILWAVKSSRRKGPKE